ncbi:DEAD/DEAH box helicase [Bradyrhizobium ottawaense]|uniref:DEAD/DEAH box helicase n=1 Tax=Bradyrhizobium ottawaense TaxID=931866 RepID=UPI0030F46789
MRREPAVVTMPTGSGKTAVLIAAAFILQARRVLIVAPGRLVREQIADEVEKLATLRSAGALSEDVPAPRVLAVKKRITTPEGWERLREHDVVVGTVQSISPAYEEIPEPPLDMFDLVLVDEAHHSPAATWKRLLDHFEQAKRVLFTATPFRQDQREIKGRFIFTYDLRRAFEDGVFGLIRYQPVNPSAKQSADEAIAIAAERQFNQDREAGFQHRVMVRTDSRRRATDLLTLYERYTKLRLKIVTGDKSLRYVRGVIQALSEGALDGIVCVNMLGEGFNFPSLKIAAIHSPHRSLSVTLQFIGRFARTVGDNIGAATFLAVPSEIEIEAERLYDARAVWQEMVQNLSAARVHEEAETREILQSFATAEAVAPDLTDLSLYVLEPYFHVKIFQLAHSIDLSVPVEFPPDLQIVFQAISEEHGAAVYITRETSLPRWSTDDRLSSVSYDLFILFQDAASNLLFICASQRTEGVYQFLVESFRDASPSVLPLVRVNRALNGLEAPEFFNVGMRNRVVSNTTESYRIVTGSNADKVIGRSDARLYHRGHAFGRGSDEGESVTIGLSSASKVWSNKAGKLPDLIQWCEKLARRISSNDTPVTGSGLDLLDAGEEIDILPPGIMAVGWPDTVYRHPAILRYEAGDEERIAQLLDLDLAIDDAASNEQAVVIVLSGDDDFEFRATFSFETDRYFEPLTREQVGAIILREHEEMPLIDFLNGEMPIFYTADLSLVDGPSLWRAAADLPPFDSDMIEAFDWAGRNVDIGREFGDGRRGMISVHTCLEAELANSANAVVYYDHGSGEIADFIAVEEAENRLIVRFYHCKSAGGAAAGHRVGDVYELAGQAVKSVIWALKQRVFANVRRRFNNRKGSARFVCGDLERLEELLSNAAAAQIEFEFIAVQPGLRKAGLPADLGNVLAAASDHLVRGGFRPLRVMASA